MKNDITSNSVIGDVVADNYRAASVLNKYKIDFCCQGSRTLKEASETAGIPATHLITELQKTSKNDRSSGIDFLQWDLDLLMYYIEKKHHRYVRTTILEIVPYLKKVNSVHGARHKELSQILDLFSQSVHDLLLHMQKEEEILFPFIRTIAEGKIPDYKVFQSVMDPINMMKQEHNNEGDRFREIARLSNDYQPPVDACNTYRVAFALLKEFEEDLHLHIHLENNILFPKALDAERILCNA